MSERDKWADWVLARGHSDDVEQRRRKLDDLTPIRQRILDNAGLRPGDVLLDVGTGDGFIGFGALDRQPNIRVIFSDISPTLVEYCERAAAAVDLDDRTDAVVAAATDLPIGGSSVDVVTTRSVLIYVDEKQRAFDEFFRVLRAGGRLSMFEPINNYFPDDPNDFWGLDATPVRDLVMKLSAHEDSGNQDDSNDPMMNFTERDLVLAAERAGFDAVHADLAVDVRRGAWAVDWQRLLNLAPNPNAPTLRESMERAFTPEERERFESYLQPLFDSTQGRKREAFAYVAAAKAAEEVLSERERSRHGV